MIRSDRSHLTLTDTGRSGRITRRLYPEHDLISTPDTISSGAGNTSGKQTIRPSVRVATISKQNTASNWHNNVRHDYTGKVVPVF
jgi:hypothetical protein